VSDSDPFLPCRGGQGHSDDDIHGGAIFVAILLGAAAALVIGFYLVDTFFRQVAA
jgi:hypothetical protein